MESLGKSLLGQQAASRAKSRKKSRKKEKISKAMAILLGGQAIFNKAMEDRSNELVSFNTIMARKNKKFVAEMKIVGSALKSLPIDMLDSKDAYKQYMNNRSYQRDFRAAVYSTISQAMKNQDPQGHAKLIAQGELDRNLYKIIDTVIAPYFLKAVDGGPSRAQKVLDAGEKYFEGIDRDQVMENLFGITESVVETNQALRLKAAKEGVRKDANWFSVPGMIGSIFKGEPTVFRALESGDYSQSGLMDLFDKDIEFSPYITPNISEVLKVWDNNRNYMNQAAMDEKLMSTAPGSRGDRALLDTIRDTKDILVNAPPQAWMDSDFNTWRKDKMKTLAEAEYLRKAIYSASPNQLDAPLGIEVANTWGALRLLFDNPDREAAYFLEDKYKVDLGSLGVRQKDALAMKIILAEGVDPIDWNEYRVGKGPKYSDDRMGNIPRTLKLYEEGDRDWELGREGAYVESNFINNLSKVQAYLTPTFKGISSEGMPEVSDAIKVLQETGDTEGVGAANITNTINAIGNQNQELGEHILATRAANDPVYAKQIKQVYPTMLDAQEAYNNGTYSLQAPQTTTIDTGYTLSPTEEKLLTVPEAVYDAGVRQNDRQAETLLERHFSGRAIATEIQVKDAMERLNIKTLEDARQQYSVQ